MTEEYIPNELQLQLAKEMGVTPKDPKYPNVDGKIMTDAAIELYQKWLPKNVTTVHYDSPLCHQELRVLKSDAAEFIADLRRLKIGLKFFHCWIDLSVGFPDRTGFCETQIYFDTNYSDTDQVTYSLDLGESIIKYYKSFNKDYYHKEPPYDDYQAIGFWVDRYGEMVDIPGERDPRCPPIYTEDF
jgi:hypothetical protein